MVRRVSAKKAHEAVLRTENFRRHAEVDRVEYPLVRVGRIVAPVLNEARRSNPDAHRLRIERDQQRIDLQVADAGAAVAEPVKNGVRLGQPLRNLYTALLALGVERAHVPGVAVKAGERQRQARIVTQPRRGVG